MSSPLRHVPQFNFMDHLETVNTPPTSSPHDLESAHIYEGENDEDCSVHVFLANMPCDMKCRRASRPEKEAAKEQLQVFWYPDSPPNQIQQKLKSVLLSLPESGYVGIFNMVQYWAPINSGNTHIILSVSKQPFGVDLVCKGVVKYRYFSASKDQVDDSDPVGRAFSRHSPEFVENVAEAYSQQLRSFAKLCGFQTSWIIPLVRIDEMLLSPVCVGVLEFLTKADIRFDFTLLDKFKKLTKHVLCALNSPSDMESPLSLLHFNYSHVDPQGEAMDMRIAPDSENGIGHQMVQHDQSSSFSEEFDSAFYQAHHADFSLAEPSFSLSEYADQGHQISTANHTYTQYHRHEAEASSSNTEAPKEEDARLKNVASYETSGSIIIQGVGSANSTPETSIKASKIGVPRFSKEVIEQHFGRKLEDASKELGVSRSTLKRYCRIYGYTKWPRYKKNKGIKSLIGVQRLSVKATFREVNVRFMIADDIDIEFLRMELGRRFELEIGSFIIQYKDDAGDLITIPCTEDLLDHISTLNSAKQEIMHLLLSLLSYPSCK